jgi:toxin ParE1/3/4
MSAEQNGYKLSPRASRDLAEIWLYTRESWSTKQADTYYRELVSAMDGLAKGTKHGKPIDDIRAGYLSCSSGSHRIIYRQQGRLVLIVRILHQRMNVRRHL